MDDTEYDEEDLADLAQDTSISDLLLRNNEEDEGANSQIWDVDVGSLLDGLLGPSPPPPVEENKTQVDIEESDLVNSICKILLKYGKDGRIQGATLGQCLAKQNKVYLKEIKKRYGTLQKLLLKYPRNFKVESDAPQNHVLLCEKVFNVPSLKSDDGNSSKSSIVLPNLTEDASAALPKPLDAQSDKSQEIIVVVNNAVNILNSVKEKKMKASSLANKLINVIGKQKMKFIKRKCGGLLNVLEAEADKFRIIRVPKDDYVELNEKIKVNVREPLGEGGADTTIGIDPKKTGAKILEANSKQVSSEAPTKCLHVPNVPPSVGKAELLKIFEAYGKVEYIKVVKNKNHKHRRMAFISYFAIDDAALCRQNLCKHRKIFRNNLRYGKKST